MKRADILTKANELIGGDRAQDYGSVKDNFERTGQMWNLYLSGRGIYDNNSTEQIEAADVAILNILQKISRLANSPDHLDSWMDIAGYAALGGEIATEK